MMYLIESIPVEIIVHIFGFLDKVEDFISLSSVSRNIREIVIQEQSFWHKLSLSQFPAESPSVLPENQTSWRSFYYQSGREFLILSS